MENIEFSVENATQRVTEDTISTVSFDCLIDGNIPTVTSCTVSITDRSGNALTTVVSGEDATVVGNKCSYILTAAQLPEAEIKYKAIWLPIIGGVTYRFVHYFDVTYKDVPILISDRDLIAENRLLNYMDEQYSIRGDATGGTTSTIVDTSELKGFFADDLLNGSVVRILDGTNSGTKRRVTDYVDSTGTITVSPVYDSSIDTTSVYAVFTYMLAIKSAVEELQANLKDHGFLYYNVADNLQIKRLQILYTCRKIFGEKMRELEDQYGIQYSRYNDLIKDKLKVLSIDYDKDDDGVVDEDDEQNSIYGQVEWRQ